MKPRTKQQLILTTAISIFYGLIWGIWGKRHLWDAISAFVIFFVIFGGLNMWRDRLKAKHALERCPDCDAVVTEQEVSYAIPYGTNLPHGTEQVMIPVTHTGFHCKACGIITTDYRGEEARSKAVEDFLKEQKGEATGHAAGVGSDNQGIQLPNAQRKDGGQRV